ncbi:MAG: C39 family peptidase [Chloroflexi bacterium]|nr:C39 family peptidase [Chloroflexota bacterium]
MRRFRYSIIVILALVASGGLGVRSVRGLGLAFDPIKGTGDFPRFSLVYQLPASDQQWLFLVEHDTATPLASLPECAGGVCGAEQRMSPDGQFIAVRTSDGNIVNLHIISTKDGSLVNLERWVATEPNATSVGAVTSFAWTDTNELLYARVLWPSRADQQAAFQANTPLPPIRGEVWRATTDGQKPALLAQGPINRVLGSSRDGKNLYVTTFVPGFEGWGSEAFAYVDLDSGKLENVWFNDAINHPYAYSIRTVNGADGQAKILATYVEQTPGRTVFNSTQKLLLFDPATRTTQTLWETDAQSKRGPADCSFGISETIYKPGARGFLFNCRAGLFRADSANPESVPVELKTLRGQPLLWHEKGIVAFDKATGRLILTDENDQLIGQIQFPTPPTKPALDGIASAAAPDSPAATNELASIQTVANAVVDWPVPYLHQLWDTPTWWNGNWSCGPTSSVMALAFYKRLAPHPITVSNPVSHNSDWGWYIPTDAQNCGTANCAGYTYTSATYGQTNFNVTKPNVSGYGAGAYGWVNDSSGAGFYANIVDYLQRHDVGAQANLGSNHLEDIKAELRAGAIVILGVGTTTVGHILIVRGYTSDNNLIVNDPNGQYLGTVGTYNQCSGSSYHCGEDIVYSYSAVNPVWYIAAYGPLYTPGIVNASGVTSWLRLANSSGFNTGSKVTAKVNWMYNGGNRNGATVDVALNNSEVASVFSIGFSGSAVIMPQQLGMGLVATRDRSSAPYPAGAISPITAWRTSSTVYVPQVFRNATTASGTANSTLYVMNTSGFATTVTITFKNSDGTMPSSGGTRTVALGAQATDAYDLSALPTNWVGSAVVSGSGNAKLAVTTGTQIGNDTWNAINNFPTEARAKTWQVPLFMSRLANGSNTPLVVQNLSAQTLLAGQLTLACAAGAGSGAPATLSSTNPSPIAPNGWGVFNPVVGGTNAWPLNWFGACTVSTPAPLNDAYIVVQVQQRTVAVALDNGTTYGVNNPNAGTYEAIPTGQGSRRLLFPVAQKLLTGGNATAVSLINLSSTQANLTLHYEGSSSCSSADIIVNKTIPANGQLIRNLRLNNSSDPNNENAVPVGWCGFLWVESDQPIGGYAQLTNVNNPSDDSLSVHNAIVQP